MSVEEVEGAFTSLATQLAMERLVRDGDVTKTGKYTMVVGETGAMFNMTEQGKGKAEGRQRE